MPTRPGSCSGRCTDRIGHADCRPPRSPTLDTYGSVYRRHVKPALGELRVREITTPVVDRVLAAVKHRSTAGARTAKVVMSQTMRLAARHGAVAYNPVPEVARIDSEPARPPRSLTAEERQQWLDAVEASEKAVNWDLPDLTRMILATGCRVGECLAIGWSEVDLDAATVDVRWRLVRNPVSGCCGCPRRRPAGGVSG